MFNAPKRLNTISGKRLNSYVSHCALEFCKPSKAYLEQSCRILSFDVPQVRLTPQCRQSYTIYTSSVRSSFGGWNVLVRQAKTREAVLDVLRVRHCAVLQRTTPPKPCRFERTVATDFPTVTKVVFKIQRVLSQGKEGIMAKNKYSLACPLCQTKLIDRCNCCSGVVIICPHCGASVLADIEISGRIRLSIEPQAIQRQQVVAH